MREIKFRAWDPTQKTMYHVNRLDWKEDGLWAHCDNQHPRLRRIMLNTEVKPLMAFTNLHDKNGTEIWEGDIVIEQGRYPFFDGKDRGYVGIIEWVQVNCAFELVYRLINPKKAGISDGVNINLSEFIGTGEYEDLLEVIGNIYENPELLESPPNE